MPTPAARAMTEAEKLREASPLDRICEALEAALNGCTDPECGDDDHRRAHGALSLARSLRDAEPVAWAPMLVEEFPDGAFYQRDDAPDPGRICAYRTREQAEEHWDETEEVMVPLYTLALPQETSP